MYVCVCFPFSLFLHIFLVLPVALPTCANIFFILDFPIKKASSRCQDWQNQFNRDLQTGGPTLTGTFFCGWFLFCHFIPNWHTQPLHSRTSHVTLSHLIKKKTPRTRQKRQFSLYPNPIRTYSYHACFYYYYKCHHWWYLHTKQSNVTTSSLTPPPPKPLP